MEFKKQNFETYNLHTVKLDTFKESRIEIVFRDNVAKDNYLKCIFLADLLTYSSSKYPRRKDMVIQTEELYQMSIFSNASRLGKSLILTLGCNFINPEYVNENDYLENVIEFLSEIIFNPNVENNKFDKTSFEIIKTNTIKQIQSIKEDTRKYSLVNMLEKMGPKEKYSLHGFGYIEEFITRKASKKSAETLYRQ